MRVILTTSRVINYGIEQHEGQELDLPPEEALALIRANQAEAIVELKETAMDEPRTELRQKPRSHKHGTSVK